jgi:monofunctional biosynthetic peptidoglycan transglycosylase
MADTQGSGGAWRTIGQVISWAGVALGIFFVGSVLWVAAYRFIDPPGTFLMSAASLSGTPVQHRNVAITAVAPVLWETIIGAEDQRFCSHFGFDLDAIDDARDEAADGGRVRGASTISQQTAKNAFLWPGRNYLRKGIEAYFTVLIESLWPKRRIMAVYLNIVEFGPGIFGAEAASQHFFAKPAKDLWPSEAALLAAVLPNPRRSNAGAPSSYLRSRADTLEVRAETVRRDGLGACVAGRPQASRGFRSRGRLK